MTPSPSPTAAVARVRPDTRFLLSHPAHLLALGFGSGLSPWAPGTMGTLWAWISFSVFNHWLSPLQWGVVLIAGGIVGWVVCTVTARDLGAADPGAIVWDEILAFWFVLWLVTPAGWMTQTVAFALFRFFDAAKPGPVRWADECFKTPPAQRRPGAAQGFGILWDDLVAAGCTLFLIALWRAW